MDRDEVGSKWVHNHMSRSDMLSPHTVMWILYDDLATEQAQ
jgi:hypothetical protein